MTTVSRRDLLLLVGICAIWGFNLVAIKAGVERMPPVFFSLLRFIVLAIAVAPFLRPRRGASRIACATAWALSRAGIIPSVAVRSRSASTASSSVAVT